MNQINKCDCPCGCGTRSKKKGDEVKKILIVTWQRLISEGNTCPRCGSTENELNKAILQLREKLNPLGVEVILKKIEMFIEEFEKEPLKSNRISFNGHSLENVMDAKTGQSQCCDVCGDKKCRTVETKEKIHETIPAEIIVEAGLKVFADL